MSTLASVTALQIGTPPVITEDARLMKTEIQAWMTGLAASDTVFLLMANGELSDSEVASAMTVAGPLSRDDSARNDLVMKNVRILGSFHGRADVEIVPILGFDGQEGIVVDKFSWTYGKTNGWKFWAFNPDGGAMETGSTMSYFAKHYGVWVH